MKRFMQRRGNAKLFNLLNNKQIKDNKKAKHCDYVVVNEKNFKILKKILSNIIRDMNEIFRYGDNWVIL